MPTVESAAEFEDLGAARVRAHNADSQLGRLSPRCHETNRLRRRDEFTNELRPDDGELGFASGVQAAFSLSPERLDHRRVGVAQQHRPVPQPVVDVAMAVYVPLMRPTFRSTKSGKGSRTRARCVYPPG